MHENDFTRERKLPFTTLVVFIVNLIKKSLQIELYSFFDFLEKKSITKQAFSQARKKLSPIVFKLLNSKLVTEFYSDNVVKSFQGFRVLAIDGSTIRLPISQELFEQYGKPMAHSYVPLARISIMFDILNNITLHSSINPYNVGEKALAAEHIIDLEQQDQCLSGKAFDNDILLFDRGYASTPLMFLLQKINKHFIMRVPKAFLTEVNDAVKTGSRDSIVTISAFATKRTVSPLFNQYLPNLDKNATMQVRVLTFELSSGETEIIVTSLVDQEKFKPENIVALYGLRWNSEEGYKFYKSILELENFSGTSKMAVEQDFFATIFASNISALLMQEVQDELNQVDTKIDQSNKTDAKTSEQSKDTGKPKLKYEYKVNRNILVGIIKNEIIGVLLSNQDLDEYCNKLKTRIKKNLVPIRPNRKYPRVFKKIKQCIKRRAL